MIGKRQLQIALSLLAIGCFVWIGRDYLTELHRIRHAHLLGIAGIVVVHLLTLWLQGLTVKWGLDAFDKPISAKESFSLFVISSYANLLLPRSGVGTTALYLNRVCKSSLIDYSSVVLVGGALIVMACSGVGCIVLAIDCLASQTAPPMWLAVSVPTMLVTSVLALLIDWNFLNKYRGPGSGLFQRLNHAMNRLARSEVRSIARMGLAHFVLVFLRALRLYIAFWALGIEISFFGALFMSVLGDLAFVFAITPSAIGFRESAIALVATRLGMPVSLALSVAILDRLVFSLTVVITSQLLIGMGIKGSEFSIRKSCPPASESSQGIKL